VWSLVLLPGLFLAGCDDWQVRKAVDERAAGLKKAVEETVKDVQESVSPTGGIELILDEPVKTDACQALFILSPSPRPTVLQLTSYENPDAETFPSVLIRAVVVAGAPADLSGKTVAAQVFVQTATDAPVWHTEPGQGVELTISEVSSTTIRGNISAGTMTSTATGQGMDVTGTFTGILRAP